MVRAAGLVDAECEAGCLRRKACIDEDEPINAGALADRLLSAGAIRFVDGCRLIGDACLDPCEGRYYILVRRGISLERAQFAVAHEIAEWWLRKLDYRGDDRELVANAIAAALLAPSRAFRRAWSAASSLVEVAADFTLTETGAALRVGEVLGRPLAVISDLTVRVRGINYAWPSSERGIRQLGRIVVPGIVRVDLVDQPERFVLFAEAA